jgi:hypothetical protein
MNLDVRLEDIQKFTEEWNKEKKRNCHGLFRYLSPYIVIFHKILFFFKL